MPCPRTSRLLVIVLVGAAIAACGAPNDPAKAPPGKRASCAADAECVVVTGTGCCVVCPGSPRSIPALAFEQEKNRCAGETCPPPSDRVECPPVEPPAGYQARCLAGTCAAVKR